MGREDLVTISRWGIGLFASYAEVVCLMGGDNKLKRTEFSGLGAPVTRLRNSKRSVKHSRNIKIGARDKGRRKDTFQGGAGVR